MVSASCQVLLTSCAYVGLGFCLSAVETRKEFVMSVVSTRVPVLHLDLAGLQLGFSSPEILGTQIFLDRAWCCAYRSPTAKCRTFPDPSR